MMKRLPLPWSTTVARKGYSMYENGGNVTGLCFVLPCFDAAMLHGYNVLAMMRNEIL